MASKTAQLEQRVAELESLVNKLMIVSGLKDNLDLNNIKTDYRWHHFEEIQHNKDR